MAKAIKKAKTSSLLNRLLSNTTLKNVATLEDSLVFEEKDLASTDIPLLNVALSGSVTGGLSAGLTFFAGPSKHFKTLYCLQLVKAYLNKHSDAVCLFYDSEFGAPQSYFEANDIDTSRVLHVPITNIEELKFDIMKQLDSVEDGDKIIFMIDSIGNLASKKEVEDSLSEKSVQDMTRSKQLKSLFRMITPHLKLKQLPMVAVNHTYDELGLFPKQIMGGGQGGMLAADSVFFLSKSQQKDGTNLVGWNFTLIAEKSRFVKEKSKFPISVTFEDGIGKYSGLLQVAQELGFVTSPKQGWYTRPTVNGDKNWRSTESECSEFWDPLLADDSDFPRALHERYAIGSTKFNQDSSDEDNSGE